MSTVERRKNWFERNPKKVIFFLVLLVVCGMAWLTEKILAPNSLYRVGTRRYIKLREPDPLYSESMVPRDEFIRDPESFGAKKGYLYRADENGFLLPSKVYDQPDLLIVFLGGSTTECTFIDEENRFPYLVGRLLSEKLKIKVNSYNGGKSCNTSLHSLNILLNKVIPLKPDIVVLMHNVNDLSILLFDNTYWSNNPFRSPILTKPFTFKNACKDFEEGFHTLRDLLIPNLSQEIKKLYYRVAGPPQFPDEFAGSRGKKIKIDKDYILKEYKRNLQTFIDICRVRNITPVLLTMANRLKENPDQIVLTQVQSGIGKSLNITYQQYKDCFHLFNETIRAVAAENRALVIDLAKDIPPDRKYICDVVHFNEAGSKMAAAVISDKLAPFIVNSKNLGNAASAQPNWEHASRVSGHH